MQCIYLYDNITENQKKFRKSKLDSNFQYIKQLNSSNDITVVTKIKMKYFQIIYFDFDKSNLTKIS